MEEVSVFGALVVMETIDLALQISLKQQAAAATKAGVQISQSSPFFDIQDKVHDSSRISPPAMRTKVVPAGNI